MKNAIFITVRTNSLRLPKKCLLEIAGKPTIAHLIDRVKRSKFADGIVLCTTTNQEDNILCDIAAKEGILFFRGSEQDKLERWRGAADKFDVEFFVTADGDDLFCEPELIDLAFRQYMKTGVDFIESRRY
jgi:spore coat polysaccharide biosynthesis protein SpsF